MTILSSTQPLHAVLMAALLHIFFREVAIRKKCSSISSEAGGADKQTTKRLFKAATKGQKPNLGHQITLRKQKLSLREYSATIKITTSRIGKGPIFIIVMGPGIKEQERILLNTRVQSFTSEATIILWKSWRIWRKSLDCSQKPDKSLLVEIRLGVWLHICGQIT